jgi:hypothetical protein
MKFYNKEDFINFIIESGIIGDSLFENYSENFQDEFFNQNEEKIQEFIKRREKRITNLKNFRLSQNSKSSWRKHKLQHVFAIRKFHKSLKGKKFHRQLARFLATRDTRTFKEKNETLKALSSLKTHLLIEMDYYRTIEDEVNLRLFLDIIYPTITEIEKTIFEDRKVDKNSLEIISSLVNNEVFCEEFNIDSSKYNEEELLLNKLEILG